MIEAKDTEMTREQILKTHKVSDGFPLDPDREFYKRLCRNQAKTTWEKVIEAVLEFIRDWEILSLSEFDAKYGVYKDALGSNKSLREYIAIHFKIGN